MNPHRGQDPTVTTVDKPKAVVSIPLHALEPHTSSRLYSLSNAAPPARLAWAESAGCELSDPAEVDLPWGGRVDWHLQSHNSHDMLGHGEFSI